MSNLKYKIYISKCTIHNAFQKIMFLTIHFEIFSKFGITFQNVIFIIYLKKIFINLKIPFKIHSKNMHIQISYHPCSEPPNPSPNKKNKTNIYSIGQEMTFITMTPKVSKQ